MDINCTHCGAIATEGNACNACIAAEDAWHLEREAFLDAQEAAYERDEAARAAS